MSTLKGNKMMNLNKKPSAVNWKNFCFLTLGRTASSFGSAAFSFGLSLYVLDLTGSASKFSMVLGFSYLPLILVNFFGGVFVDRHPNKKNIIVFMDILGGITILVFMALFNYYSKSILLLIVYNITVKTLFAFCGLAINASIPNFVSEDLVPKLNSSIQAITAISNIAGPILGAIIYKAFGLQVLFLFNGSARILEGALVSLIKYRSSAPVNREPKNYLADMKVTFEYLSSQKVVGFLFIFAIVVNFIFNSLMLLVLPYINYHVIKISGFQLSLVQASGALGVILGALFVSSRSDQTFLLRKFFTLFRLQAFLIILWIFPLVPFFSETNKWPIAILFSVLLILYGGMNTSQNVPMISYFQLRIPEKIRARVFGVFWTALYATTPLGLWVYGLILNVTPWFYVTLISGLLMMTIAFFFARHRYFKEFLAGLNGATAATEAGDIQVETTV